MYPNPVIQAPCKKATSLGKSSLTAPVVAPLEEGPHGICFLLGRQTFNRLVTKSCLTLWPYGREPTRLLCPWDSLGKNTEVGCQLLLQGIFPTQGSNPHLLSPVGDKAGRLFASGTIREALECSARLAAQPCPALCDPVACSLPGTPECKSSSQ